MIQKVKGQCKRVPGEGKWYGKDPSEEDEEEEEEIEKWNRAKKSINTKQNVSLGKVRPKIQVCTVEGASILCLW
jgi:hypothetical protein